MRTGPSPPVKLLPTSHSWMRGVGACCACWSGRSPPSGPPDRYKRRSMSCGNTRRPGPSSSSCSTAWPAGSITSSPPSTSTPGFPPGPRPLHAQRDPRRVRRGHGRQAADVANGRVVGAGDPHRRVRLHARQERRGLLPYHPLPGLRHQPQPHPLGASVVNGSRRRHRPAVHHPAAGRHERRAFRPASLRRPGALVPRHGRCRSHDGDRPIAFVWELDHPLPADLYTSFAAAVA